MSCNPKAFASEASSFHEAVVGMKKADFLKIYPKDQIRTFRIEGPDQWITYNEPLSKEVHHLVTFYFQGDQLAQWKLNDRSEVTKEYLSEFCSLQGFPIIYTAIKNVLEKMPYKDFLTVTDRNRPVIFTEFYDSGTARFASSQEFIVSKDDPPCCKEGFTLIKLGLSLGLAKTPEPVEGVVAHELAHRVLDHIRKGNINCDAERRSNRLIKEWGFTSEFKEASQLFGQRKGDPAGCQEKK
jgi:hypothetical protein